MELLHGEPNSSVDNNNHCIIFFKSFDYKTSITGQLEGTNTEIVVPLKYLSSFWRTLDILLINCEVSLTSSLIIIYCI